MTEARLHILRCDDVPEPDRTRHGDTHERLAAHLRAACERLGVRAALGVSDVRAGALPAADAADVFVTTGSATDPDSRELWVEGLRRWLQASLPQGLRLYGICFGHQLAAHALGAPVGRAAGWEVGAVASERLLQLLPGGADLGPAGVRAAAAAATATLLHSHRDEVRALPAGAQLWLRGRGPCAIHGYAWWGAEGPAGTSPPAAQPRRGAVVGVQGHPEFACDQARDLYARRRQVLGDAACDGAIASAATAADGLALSAEVLAFLLPAGR